MDEKNLAWDCRWPDPVALRVASQRILDNLDPDRNDINRRIALQVEMDSVPVAGGFPNALLISPWGVERIYWSPFGMPVPPISSAQPLEVDDQGRIVPGQGLLLLTEPRPTPVLLGWEPEMGHHFIQSLLTDMLPYANGHQALVAAFADSSPILQGGGILEKTPKGLAKPVSRRGMLAFLR